MALTTLAAVGIGAAAGAGETGVVEGRLTDNGRAVVGTEVVLAGGAEGDRVARRTRTDALGRFRFDRLGPGRYLVSVRTVARSVTLTAGEQSRVDIEIESHAPAEPIPLPGKTHLAFLDLAPGAAGDPVGVGFLGAQSVEGLYSVEGMDSREVARGGPGLALDRELTGRVEVEAPPLPIERGPATGGSLDAELPRGGRSLRGSVFHHITPGPLLARPPDARDEAATVTAERTPLYDLDGGATVSGPIFGAHVFLFAGVAAWSRRVRVDRVVRRRTDCRTILADGALSPCDPRRYGDGVPDRDRDGALLLEGVERRPLTDRSEGFQAASALDFEFDRHRARVALITTAGSSVDNGVLGERSAVSRESEGDDTLASARWSWRPGEATTLSARAGWRASHRRSGSVDPSADREPEVSYVVSNLGALSEFESDVVGRECTDGGPADPYPFIEDCPVESYKSGGPGRLVDDLEQRAQGEVAIEHRVGRHRFGAGAALRSARLRQPHLLSGGVSRTVLARTLLETRWLDRGDELSSEAASLFVRDRWDPLPGLRLDLGLRRDQSWLRRHLAFGAWSPRLGANWQGPAGLALHAEAGRATGDLVPGLAEPRPRAETTWLECASPNCDVDERSVVGGEAPAVASGLGPPRIDDVAAGLRYGAAGVQMAAVYRHRSLRRVVEDVTLKSGPLAIANPGEGAAGRFDRPARRTDALTFAVSRRFVRGYAGLTYTLSRTVGDYPGPLSPDNGQTSPFRSSQYDRVELLANRRGPLPQDRRHALDLVGYALFDVPRPHSVVAGGRLRVRSGAPIDLLGGHPEYGLNESFLLPRGSGGRTDVDVRLDLHLGFLASLGEHTDLELFADVLGIGRRDRALAVEELYTSDSVLPISGGDEEDLVFAKRLSNAGLESAEPLRRTGSYGEPTAYGLPARLRLGVRLRF